MQITRSFGQFLTVALAASPLASAIPWSQWLPEIDAVVVRRADASTSAPAATTTAKQPQTTNLNTGAQKTGTASATGSNAGTGTKTTGGSSDTASHPTFNPVDPAGGISMITPAATAGVQLYKIGQTVTFAWNYTSLQGTPTAVNVLASCSSESLTWTISANMSYQATQTVTWDTNGYQQTAIAQPLITQEYTLVVYDAAAEITATPEAGYLATFNSFKFGLYEGKPYKDLGEWKCATCSGAAALRSKVSGLAMGMCIVTVLSFTWFVTGFGTLL